MSKKQATVVVDPLAVRMAALFAGNQRSSGRFDPMKDQMFTEYAPAMIPDWERHINGQMGLGIVPIQDDDTCVWAALDIDNHETDEDLPLDEFVEKVAMRKLPLICCRSKSGGIHAYLFLEKPQPAAKVRTFMGDWAGMLGVPSSEIFPKQGRLAPSKTDGRKTLGNWLNMPYLGNGKTTRYCRYDGRTLKLDEFLTVAEKHRVPEAGLRAFSSAEHPQAPPCIQKMMAHGVAQGHRNEALYNIMVYYRKAVPDASDAQAKAAAANSSIFTKPLPRGEMQRTIASAGRPDCTYRCSEEPIRSLCDRETCVTRKFGITSGDLERLNTTDALPIFSNLVKYVTEPVRWEFEIDGVRITNVKTGQLLDWRALREIIADRLTKVVPLIRGQEWERILHPLMSTARVVETPDDASIAGAIRAKLLEFAAKADLSNRGEDRDERRALLRGLPVIQVAGGERCVVFRGTDFINYLKRTKSEELKGVDLWFAVKGIGVFNERMRIGSEANINVWCIPVRELTRAEVKPVEFRSEL